MATNPLQQMIPMVLQQVMQNPQMLQQIMQMASSPQAQGMLQMLMQPGQQQPTPGSQELSDVPLPRSLGGGSPYPTFNTEQDDKAYVRELRQDNLVPPSYPRGQPLTPEILEILQRQKPPEPTPQTHPEEYLNPGTREPIAQVIQQLMQVASAPAGQSMPQMMEDQSSEPEDLPGVGRANAPYTRGRSNVPPAPPMPHPEMLRQQQDRSRPPKRWKREEADDTDPNIVQQMPPGMLMKLAMDLPQLNEDEETIEQES
jgi:hypothetical protein